MFTKEQGYLLNKSVTFDGLLAANEETLRSVYARPKKVIPGPDCWVWCLAGDNPDRMRAELKARGFEVDPRQVAYALKVYL